MSHWRLSLYDYYINNYYITNHKSDQFGNDAVFYGRDQARELNPVTKQHF